MVTPYTMMDLMQVNRTRANRWHQGADDWTGADWSNAMCGEAGEAANVVKKLRRHETHIGSSYNTPVVPDLIDALSDEIADVVLYADLLGYHYGIATSVAIRRKFNRVSEAQGFPERI